MGLARRSRRARRAYSSTPNAAGLLNGNSRNGLVLPYAPGSNSADDVPSTRWSVISIIRSWSASGTPISAQITPIGIGAATSATQSPPPAASRASRRAPIRRLTSPT